MNRGLGVVGVVLALTGVVAIGAGVVLGAGTGSTATGWPAFGPGIMGGGAGMMGGAWGNGMMGGTGITGATAPGPGEPGFVAGTVSAPRVVRIVATPTLRFVPDVVSVKAGETIRFDVTTMGPVTHEFMVGPADVVAADTEGTPEIADIGMMQTKSLTYTFDGSGPYAFACHVPGHYEAGMTGTIVVVG